MHIDHLIESERRFEMSGLYLDGVICPILRPGIMYLARYGIAEWFIGIIGAADLQIGGQEISAIA